MHRSTLLILLSLPLASGCAARTPPQLYAATDGTNLYVLRLVVADGAVAGDYLIESPGEHNLVVHRLNVAGKIGYPGTLEIVKDGRVCSRSVLKIQGDSVSVQSPGSTRYRFLKASASTIRQFEAATSSEVGMLKGGSVAKVPLAGGC